MRHQRPNRTSVDFKVNVNPTNAMQRHKQTSRFVKKSPIPHTERSDFYLPWTCSAPSWVSLWFREALPRISQKTVGEKQVATGTEFDNCHTLRSLCPTLISQLTESQHSESVDITPSHDTDMTSTTSSQPDEIAPQPSHTPRRALIFGWPHLGSANQNIMTRFRKAFG